MEVNFDAKVEAASSRKLQIPSRAGTAAIYLRVDAEDRKGGEKLKDEACLQAGYEKEFTANCAWAWSEGGLGCCGVCLLSRCSKEEKANLYQVRTGSTSSTIDHLQFFRKARLHLWASRAGSEKR